MSDLTKKQRAELARFGKGFKKFLNDNSIPNPKNENWRHLVGGAFSQIYYAATRLSKLDRVMNSLTFLELNGRTKRTQQKRYAEDHPTHAGELVFKKVDGQWKPVFEPERAVMYTAEAFRKMRQEATGLKTPETVYFVKWADIPKKIREAIAEKFPWPVKGYPQFVPANLCLVWRKGDKPARGEKRSQWMPPQFVISGNYGDDPVVITKAVIWNRGCFPKLAKAIGVEAPDMSTEEQKPEKIDPGLRAAANLLQVGAGVLDDVMF